MFVLRKSVCIAAISILLCAAGAAHAQIRGLDITGIRAWADGSMNLYFRTNVTPACGGVIRVSGEGKEAIKSLALAALLSGRSLTVDVEPEKTGNFCNLIYLRFDAP